MANIHHIDSMDDPAVHAYCNMKERTLRGESIFLGEGMLLVRRMLASRYPVDSILVSEPFLDEAVRIAPEDMTIYVGAKSLLTDVIGYHFHRGAMAIGRRLPDLTMNEWLDAADVATCTNVNTSYSESLNKTSQRQCVIVAPNVSGPENVGLIFRSAAALGASGIILGRESNDPLSRRALRLSMGSTLTIPHILSDRVDLRLQTLCHEHGFESVAAVLDDQAVLLDRFKWPERTALLMGNEFHGLPDEIIQQADHLVTIPMHHGTDSLNLSVSTGVLLYDCMRDRPGK